MRDEYKNLPKKTLERLPIYYNVLENLYKTEKAERISSAKLSKITKFNANQIRQDLNVFGSFGLPGYGYNVEILMEEIAEILNFGTRKKTIIVGVTSLTRSFMESDMLDKRGFDLIGAFDPKQSLIGYSVNGTPIRDINSLDDFCKENRPQMAILNLSENFTDDIYLFLVKNHVKAFWNFGNKILYPLNKNVIIENINIADQLSLLSLKLKE